jgi:hypothetical protein
MGTRAAKDRKEYSSLNSSSVKGKGGGDLKTYSMVLSCHPLQIRTRLFNLSFIFLFARPYFLPSSSSRPLLKFQTAYNNINNNAHNLSCNSSSSSGNMWIPKKKRSTPTSPLMLLLALGLGIASKSLTGATTVVSALAGSHPTIIDTFMREALCSNQVAMCAASCQNSVQTNDW